MPGPDDFSREPEAAVFAFLHRLGLPFSNLSHPPTHTVADSRLIKTEIAGGHTKNLFMKDKSGALVLVSAWAESQLPLNQLHKALRCQRLSFGPADLMWAALGVTPGSVSGFALLHDQPAQVRFVLDAALGAFDVWNFHPLRNDMTTSIRARDFLTFAVATGHAPDTVDFRALAGEPGQDG
jgi:Ala-tRNA(Pro) deacylase